MSEHKGDVEHSNISLELLRQAQAGDTQAVNRLFGRYMPPLLRFAHRRVPTWARGGMDTGDFVQDTVLQAFKRLKFFEPRQDGALLGYLRRALLNRIRDQFRRAARRPAPQELDESTADSGASPLQETITKEDRARYIAGLAKLKPADREAIVGRVELGYSYEQLALVLKKPTPEAARLAVRRALLRLGEQMQQG
ncbi:MAG: sigma-70 family RNA polymerase sigma factor [Vicinamibacterales bacterium]